MPDFFKNVDELEKNREMNEKKEQKAKLENQIAKDKEAADIRESRKAIISEFYQKMQQLGVPHDKATPTGNETTTLDTKAYRLEGGIFVSCDRFYYSIKEIEPFADFLILDIIYMMLGRKELIYKEIKLEDIDPFLWAKAVAAMQHRLENYNAP